MLGREEVLQNYHKEQEIVQRLMFKSDIMTIDNCSLNHRGKYLTLDFVNASNLLTADHARHEQLCVDLMSANVDLGSVFASSRDQILYDSAGRTLRLKERKDWKLVNINICVLNCSGKSQIVQIQPVFLRPEVEIFPHMPENQPQSEIEFLLHPSDRLEPRYLDWLEDGNIEHQIWMEQNCIIGNSCCTDLEMIVYRNEGKRAGEMAFVVETHYDEGRSLAIRITEILKHRKNRRLRYFYLDKSVIHAANMENWQLEIYEWRKDKEA